MFIQISVILNRIPIGFSKAINFTAYDMNVFSV